MKHFACPYSPWRAHKTAAQCKHSGSNCQFYNSLCKGTTNSNPWLLVIWNMRHLLLEKYSWGDLHAGSKRLRHSNAYCTAEGPSVGNLYHTLHKLIWQRNKQSSYLHQLRWILCMSFMGPSAFHGSVEGGGCCCWCDASSASSRAAASWEFCFHKIKL